MSATPLTEKSLRDRAAAMCLAFERTADIRAKSPQRFAAFDADTDTQVMQFQSRIDAAASAHFSDATAISDGLVATEQLKKYLIVRTTDREGLAAQIEGEVRAINTGVSTITGFYWGVRQFHLQACAESLLPFSRDMDNALELAHGCDAVKFPDEQLQMFRDFGLSEADTISAIKEFLKSEGKPFWRI
jgi:hypothetical protein